MATITSSVEGVSSSPAGTVYTVKVVGPAKTPDGARELRARRRALAASGVLGPVFNTIRGITAGELDRLTEHQSMKEMSNGSKVKRETIHKVLVED